MLLYVCIGLDKQLEVLIMFCSKCGVKLPDGSSFCNECGFKIYATPRKPGKGLGITSMVLGIFALIYSAMALMIVTTTQAYNGYHVQNDFFEGNVLSMIIGLSVFAVLACIFSIYAIKKGYKNGISISGLAMGVISVMITSASIIVLIVSSM
jgi:predicted nucleic acid-binding Zn ribbon protein